MNSGVGRVVNILCWPELVLGFIQFLLGFRTKQPMAHQDPMLDDHSLFSLCAQEEIRPGRSVNVLHLPFSPTGTGGSADDLTIFFVHGSMANMQQWQGQAEPIPASPLQTKQPRSPPLPPRLAPLKYPHADRSAPASIAPPPGPGGKSSANQRKALTPPAKKQLLHFRGRCHVVAYDAFGCGRSPKPRDFSAYSFAEMMTGAPPHPRFPLLQHATPTSISSPATHRPGWRGVQEKLAYFWLSGVLRVRRSGCGHRCVSHRRGGAPRGPLGAQTRAAVWVRRPGGARLPARTCGRSLVAADVAYRVQCRIVIRAAEIRMAVVRSGVVQNLDGTGMRSSRPNYAST